MSLRDALLKAGKVSKGQAQKARTAKRKKRKKKGGGHRVEAQQDAEVLIRETERREAQATNNRIRATEDKQQRKQHEHLMRIGNLIHAWRRRPKRDAQRRWYFVRSSGEIGLVLVDSEIAAELEFGSAGIVELPENEGAVEIVAAEGLRKLVDIHRAGVRFYVGAGATSDDPLTCPPPRPTT